MCCDGHVRVGGLLSVNVGLPKDVAWRGETVHTGVWKEPVEGPRMVRRLNIDGDGQGDTAGHGGEQRAVLVYQIDSYRYWESHLGRGDLTAGSFGENLTVDGLADDEVCVGDRYRIGEAEFEVTQPRVTCYRVGLRLAEPELPALLVSHHRPGFYMRVITEGHIRAGDQIVQTRTGPGALTVAATDALLYLPDRDEATLRRALRVPALSPGWQQSFRELLEHPGGAGTSPSSAASAGPAWPGFRPLVVTAVVPEADTVSSIYLAAPDATPLPPASPGSYVTIRTTGAGRPAPVRSYSLSSDTTDGRYRISVKREPQGVVSTYLNRSLRVGATLDVAAPRGEFVLDTDTNPVLFVSAGIGVTPVLAMLHHLVAERSERDIWWIHGARGPDDHTLAAEAHDLLASLPRAHEHIFYSVAVPADDQRSGASAGRITEDGLRRLDIPADASAYVCGPPAFMAEIPPALVSLGIPSDRIHSELFTALAASTPGITGATRRPPHRPAGAPGDGPLVTFSRSGISTPFDTTARSILELADACDISTRWSCRAGVCHTCVTPLLSGDITYDPAPLELPTDGEVLICCARPRTEVVLDL